MITVAAAIAATAAGVQFIKKLLPSVVQGVVAQGITVVVAIAVTAYAYVSSGTPFTFAAVTFLIAVIVGAMGAYGLIKVAGGSAEKGGSATTTVPPVK